MINVYTDGGARGNPGPAALGVYIEKENGEMLIGFGKAIGETTNNVAEYSAILAAFEWLLSHQESVRGEDIQFSMDSQLAYSQLVGIYRIKNAKLRELLFLIRQRESELGARVFYRHVPREQNKKADYYVNNALDKG